MLVNRDRIARTEGTPEQEKPDAKVIKNDFGKPESTADTANK